MANTYSFDVVSKFDAGEMNNVFDQTKREIQNRYDFKGSAATIEWLGDDKDGFKITGDNNYHLEAIIEMVRKKASTRGISQKVFDTSADPENSNLKTIWNVPFIEGLDKEKTKKVTKLLRDKLPKIKTQIQGDEVRVSSQKKDQLQMAMDAIREAEFDFPTDFINFR